MKAIAGMALFAGLALAQGNLSDSPFAGNAAMGGLAQVDMGKMAVQKGAGEQVRSLGQRIVDDHSRMNDQLKSLAAKDKFSFEDVRRSL